MSSQLFEVKERRFEGQHIREYPRATAHSQEDVLQLCAKQYIPRNNPHPQPGDVTIIAAHANGFVKEMYEPMWDDLLAASEAQGFRIRSIWITDVAWQGQSGIVNEDVLGNDPSWYDHARDLLQMVNTFRRDMPRPLVGIGHSFGGTMMTYLSLMHPRLLMSLVLLDPVLNFRLQGREFGFTPLELSAVRRDLWPSREAAAASFGRSAFYQKWDKRVFDRWIEHGLRAVPTKVYPDAADATQDGPPPVTLTTTKHQEVFTFLRPLWQGVDPTTGKRLFQRDRIPDITDESIAGLGATGKLYRPEAPNTARQLPHVRPGVVYVFGGQSPMSSKPVRDEKMELTGVGVGGSGGVHAGRVRQVVLEEAGHLVAMEQPGECAAAAASWIGQELKLWRAQEAELSPATTKNGWWGRTDREKQQIDEEFESFVGHRLKEARAASQKKKDTKL